MAEALRVLILEANPADAELARFELEDAGLVFTSKVVMTEEDFVRAIQEFSPDLILSGYDLPKYNGALALAEAKRRCPDTPFILVTGAVTEDRAIDILSQGAEDYVLKNRLGQRLVPAVRRALAEAEEHRARTRAEGDGQRLLQDLQIHQVELEMQNEELKRARDEAEAERERYINLYDFAPAGYFTLDSDGNIRSVNLTGASLLGVERSRLLGSRFGLFVSESDVPPFNSFLESVFEGRVRKHCTVTLGREECQRLHIQIEAITSEDGQECRAVVLDVTERKRLGEAEEFQRQNREAAERLASEMTIIAEIGRVVGSNLNIHEVYGRMVAEIGKLIPFDSLTVNRANLQREELEVAYVAGLDVPDRRVGDSFPLRGTIGEEAVRTKKGVIRQSENPEELVSAFPGLIVSVRAGMLSVMTVPLIYRDEVIGNLIIRSKKPHAYSKENLQLAEKIGIQIAGAIANARLFTEHEKTEEKLCEVTERLHLATASAKAGVWDWNLRTNEMVWDDRMLELYGLTRENFPGRVEAWEQGLHPDDSSRAIEECQAALRGERDFGAEFRIRRPDGTVVHIKANGLVLRDEKGKPLRMIGLNTDITDRKRAEEALRESEERFRLAYSTSPDAININRMSDGLYVDVNEGFTRLTGFAKEDVIGKTSLDIDIWQNPADRRELIHKLKEDGYCENLEADFRRKDGSIATALMSARVIVLQDDLHILSITRDISERKRSEEERERLQAQLLQSQKMESVGRLAGGVAHDFNNMLGVILGRAEMALDQLAPSDPLHTDLEEIRKAAHRSADLTKRLLAFARKQTISPKVLDLNNTVEGMLKILQRLIGEDIVLKWRPSGDLWPVKLDPSQIDQILANLVVNARDAIPGVGRITIETGNRTLDETFCATHAGCVPGEYVLLDVSDNGCGMDKETQSHLFEPFFTTKGIGKGTGLGLAMVYGIVKQNDGFIEVFSEPGQGTTFRIHLPRNVGKAGPAQIEGTARPAVRGHEIILLVEDEPAILEMTMRMLERQGYVVLAASTPGEAIRLAQEHADDIHLLMTDVVMPEMNGRDLAKNLLSLYPKLKRLFMSGYTADVIAHHGVLDDGVHFIQKPFSMKDLATKVREALDQK